METDVIQRLKKFMQYKNISVNAFAKALSMPQVTVNNYISGKRKVSFELIERIASVYPDISGKWLLTGEGMMLVNNEAVPVAFERRAGIPLVSQYAYAGYLAGYGDLEYIESLPLIDFTPDREMTGNWLAFEVRGDSMDDGTKHGYEQGEIVICREIEPYLYKDSRLHFNQRDFVIVHEDGILLKRVIEHNVENHTIVIHSLNPEYPDRTINLAQVRQIFSIVESRMQRKR